MSTWRRRVIVIALATAGIDSVMVGAGMGPNLVVVSVLVALAAVAVWLAFDLAAEVEPAVRPDTSPAARRAAGVDWSVSTMVLQLQTGNERFEDESAHQLYHGLVSLIDDQLLAEHRVDRATDHELAWAIMGAELTRFVSARQPPRGFTEPRTLAHIVTLIEGV